MIRKQIALIKNPIVLCMVLSFFAIGGFHTFISAAISIFLFVYLLILKNKQNKILFFVNIYSVSVAVLCLFYFSTLFWAVDKLSAIYGFIKFLPLLLLILCLMQTDCEKAREDVLSIIPACAVLMTVVSAILMQIPALKTYFSVAGRLAGFFQYPNTFALFLLVAIIICGLDKKEKLTVRLIAIGILLFGIIYSGSRTAMLIAFPVFVLLVIMQKNKKFTISVSLVFVGLIAMALGYALIKNDFSVFGRFTQISLKSSTFLGRILYNKDALKLVAKYPFGMGYLGYNYLNQTVQTGVYTVRFVHNDWLGMLLDCGFIPFVLFVFSVVRFFFEKNENPLNKIIVAVISFHSLLDFDFQFVSIFLLFVMVLPVNKGEEKELNRSSVITVSALLTAFSLYIGSISFLCYSKCYKAANDISFLNNTEALMGLLSSEEDNKRSAEIADKILESNPYVAAAYNAKALAAFEEGDFATVIANKEKALDCEPYNIDSYNEYAYMLLVGRNLYIENGDNNSAEYCRKYIRGIESRLQTLKENTDKIAFMIKDKPEFSLSDEITKSIEEIG